MINTPSVWTFSVRYLCLKMLEFSELKAVRTLQIERKESRGCDGEKAEERKMEKESDGFV